MKQRHDSISKKNETIEILQSPEIMKQILESEKNISKRKLKKLDI